MKIAPKSLPSGYSVFCDDIRFEVDGKRTLVGVYSGEMTVWADQPVAIPLAVDVHMHLERDASQQTYRFEAQLKRGDSADVLFTTEVTLPPDDLPPLGPESEEPGSVVQSGVGFQAKWPAILVAGDSKIVVRAYTDDMEIRLGGLRILLRPTAERPA